MAEVECKIEIKHPDSKEIVELVNHKYLTDLTLNDSNSVNTFIWEDGNYSCDCNRNDFFYQVKNNAKPFEADMMQCGDTFKIRITRLDTNEVIYDQFKEE